MVVKGERKIWSRRQRKSEGEVGKSKISTGAQVECRRRLPAVKNLCGKRQITRRGER